MPNTPVKIGYFGAFCPALASSIKLKGVKFLLLNICIISKIAKIPKNITAVKSRGAKSGNIPFSKTLISDSISLNRPAKTNL